MGFKYYQALTNFDFVSVWQMIKMGVEYPFLQALWMGVFGRVFGYSIEMARLANLILAIPIVKIIFLICDQLKKDGWRLKIIFCFCFSVRLYCSM